ncbi:MAG: arsenate reductase ArsC [Planctomycetes bacterium]|nr:arsenate reductase ArsC [Planctomycetota bacterium]
MAEGWLRHLAKGKLVALSAGTQPTRLDPQAVRVMAEINIDISRHSASAFTAHLVDPPELVIALCRAVATSCASLPRRTAVLSWPFEDPTEMRGSELEVLRAFRSTRDAIGVRIETWMKTGCAGLLPPARPLARSGRAPRAI